MLDLRSLPVNHFWTPQEARIRVSLYEENIENGFELCSDDDLSCILPTVFTNGESLATLLLGNLEHLINHKYQLFMYLKLLGVPVVTKDLYAWRGDAGQAAD